MRRILAGSAFLLLVSAVPAQSELYSFTVSESATDPFVNGGPVTGGTLDLYLWLVCEQTSQGMAIAELSFASPPGAVNLGFTTMNGALNAGDSVNLLLAIGGCPSGPLVLGAWHVLNSAAGSYCLVPDSVTGDFGVFGDCDCLSCFTGHPVVQRGYSAGDGAADCPMSEGFLCGPTAIDRTSWGRAKSRFR